VPEHELSDSYDGLLAQVSAAIVEARVSSQLAVVSELARVHPRLAEGAAVRDERAMEGDVPLESDLDREMANDPYLLDFLGIEQPTSRTNTRRASEHAVISTLEAYLLRLRTGFALAGCPYRVVTADEGVVSIDLLFLHIPTKRYIAIVVADEGPMDFVVDKARHLAAVVDDTAIGVHNETIGLAVLATDDGAITRYSYPDGTDAASKAFMPDKDDLTAVLSGAVDVLMI
jgi:predicted nuclease of restriction endonuclease-like (RecB) superfamily